MIFSNRYGNINNMYTKILPGIWSVELYAQHKLKCNFNAHLI